MAQAPSILNADRGRANATAIGVLGLLAAVQVILGTRAVWREAKTEQVGGKTAVTQASKPLEMPVAPVQPTVSFSPPPVGQISAPAPVPVVAASGPGVAPRMAPPAIGSFSTPGSAPAVAPVSVPAAVPPPSPPAQPMAGVPARPPVAAPPPVKSTPPVAQKPAAPAADPVASMSLEEMISLAKQVRGLGDMQGALDVLKRADLQFPARPEVLAETAQCYETMGLTDKASALWRQLESMDPARAAGFRDLAQRRLSNPPPSPGGTSSALLSGGGESGKILSLGACQAVKDPSAVNGEKVVLRIPILRQGNASIDPGQVDIDVYFFDRVNGEKIAQTIADEPVSAWAAAPVDWSGIGEEPLDVTYFLPALTPGEMAAHGRRSYHGYVVRLYYQHKLQDVAAEPRDLLDFGARSVPVAPAGANPLLPPVAN